MAISNEVIWVTGASSGLGYELAKQLAGAGNTVIASARNLDALKSLQREAPSNIEILDFDLLDDAALSEAQARLKALSPKLDRVILNAGTCEYMDPLDFDWSLAEKIMRVNYVGMVNSLSIAYDLLRESERGHIVGIASQASELPFTRAEAYGASKAAVQYFLQSLRLDVKQFGIDVTVVLPGFVDTPLTRRNTFSMPFLMPAEEAAGRIIGAIEKRVLRYAFPRRLSAMLWMLRRVPRLWLSVGRDKSSKNNTQGAESRQES